MKIRYLLPLLLLATPAWAVDSNTAYVARSADQTAMDTLAASQNATIVARRNATLTELRTGASSRFGIAAKRWKLQ